MTMTMRRKRMGVSELTCGLLLAGSRKKKLSLLILDGESERYTINDFNMT